MENSEKENTDTVEPDTSSGVLPLEQKVANLSAAELFDLVGLAVDAKLNHYQNTLMTHTSQYQRFHMNEGRNNSSANIGYHGQSSPLMMTAVQNCNNVSENIESIEKAQAVARMQHLQQLSREASSASFSQMSDFTGKEASLSRENSSGTVLSLGRAVSDGSALLSGSSKPFDDAVGTTSAYPVESTKDIRVHSKSVVDDAHMRKSSSTGEKESFPSEHLMSRTVSLPVKADLLDVLEGSNVPLQMQLETMRNRVNSESPRNGPIQTQKSQFSYSPMITSIPGCDPRSWVVAAGILEKKRDGKLREGWANRFFVLTSKRLFYYRVPKKDADGDSMSLLGEERGSIRLVDIQDVKTGAGYDGWYIYMNLSKSGIKRNATFTQASTSLTLRCAGQQLGLAWEQALVETIKEAIEAAKVQNLSQSPTGSMSPTNETRKSARGLSPTKFASTRTLRHFTTSGKSSVQSPKNLEKDNLSTNTPSSPLDASMPSKPSLTKFKSLANIIVDESETENILRASALDLIDKTLEENATEYTNAANKGVALNPILLSFVVLFSQSCSYYALSAGVDVFQLWFVTTFAAIIILLLYRSLTASVSNAHFTYASAFSEYRNILQELRALIDEVPQKDVETKDGEQITDNIAEPKSPSTKFAESGKPLAGLTGHDETGQDENAEFPPNSFQREDGTSFKVRDGPNYYKNKKKNISAETLYDIVAQDVVKDEKIIKNASEIFELPKPRPGIDNLEDIKKTGLPRIIIFNIQAFLQSPPMFGSNESDPGCSIVQYYHIKPETVQACLDGTESTAVKLWKRYFDEWENSDDMRKRLKGICIVRNLSSLGSLSRFEGYNGKPFILNKCVKRHVGEDFIEFNVNIRLFSFVAKRLIHTFMDSLKKLHLSAAMVIQAEEDNEMPEGVLCCAHIRNLDPPKQAVHLSEINNK